MDAVDAVDAVEPHEISLLRLVAQQVVAPSEVTTSAAVDRLLAVQAQDLPGALTSIALRTRGATLDDVRAAFDARVLVRTWPMRGTLHVVGVADVRWMLELLTTRPLAAAARRRKDLGLDDDALRLAQDVVERRLGGGGALTRAQVLAEWTAAGLEPAGGRGYHLLAHLATTGVLVLGPFVGGEQAFVLLEEWAPQTRALGREEALATLALRFFRGHGPATEADLARWAGLPLGDVRRGVAAAGEQLATVRCGDVVHLLDPEVPGRLDRHRDAARGTFLLPGFDEMVLGYADRTATLPAEHAAAVVPGGNGVFRPTVVHDGVAVGTWRWIGSGSRRRVEAEPFGSFPAEVMAHLPELAAALPV